ncbi:MAG: hypothetical protein JSR93_06760 [Verrucomicrobia bacterium]|nr:hypothetical protein [Verrucomicrobiota bacterium]
MKFLSIFLCLTLLSSGCLSKNENTTAVGPLNKVKDYVVIPLFLTNEISEREILLNYLVESLEKLGNVDISTECIKDIPRYSAGLLISLSEFETSKTGSINIIAEGELFINKYKTSCDVWKTTYLDPTLPYPVDEENGIVFKRDSSAEMPNLKTIITQLIMQFSEQYRQDNPHSVPTFHIYKRMFQDEVVSE